MAYYSGHLSHRSPWTARPHVGTTIGAFIDIDLGQILSQIPGSDWIADVASSIGDKAKTPLGFQILFVISAGLSTVLAPIVGPEIATVAFATPGLVAGDSFTKSYVEGMVNAVAITAAVLAAVPGLAVAFAASVGVAIGGAAGSLGVGSIATLIGKWSNDIVNTINRPEFQQFVNSIGDQAKQAGVSFGDMLNKLGITITDVGQKFNVRPDVAAHAVNAVAHQPVYDTALFDVITGKPYPPVGQLPVPLTLADVPANLSSQAYIDLDQRAKADGRVKQDVLDAINSFFLIAQTKEVVGTDPYKLWKAMAIQAQDNPGDARIAAVADQLKTSYLSISTPSQRLKDSTQALAAAEAGRAHQAELQPPVPPEVLAKLDTNIASLKAEVAANQQEANVEAVQKYLPPSGLGFTIRPSSPFAAQPVSLKELAFAVAILAAPTLFLLYTPWGKRLLGKQPTSRERPRRRRARP